jgi:carbon-monoxide dehydrogenase medium subunit
MKPAPFDYFTPASVEEALAHVTQLGNDAKILAGGQSLVPTMNFRLTQPSALIDLNGISELFYIHPANDGGVLLGAMTRQRTVERDPLIAQRAPLVHAAMPFIAHTQVRARGTFGGSIAHADPAAELPAVTVALGARYRLRNRARDRWISAEDFFVGLFTTLLEPDELLVEIALPPMPPHSGWSFQEVARQSGAFGLVGVATVVTLDDTKQCRQARMAFLSCGEKPMMGHHAAKTLVGQTPTSAAIRAAAEIAARDDVDPSGDIHASADYRRHLVKVLAVRSLTEAFQRANLESPISIQETNYA